MKKLTRKLFLSVAALAVCAATLVSTTFAWYVSNTEATVDGVNGSVASASTDGNLLVADGNAATALAARAYGSKLTIGEEYLSDVELSPATKATAPVADDEDTEDKDETVLVGDWVDKEGNKLANQTPYIEFTFWVLSTGEQTSVNLTYNLKNTTVNTALVPQTSYNSNGMPTGVSQGGTFTVDALYAMRMEIYKQEETSGSLSALSAPLQTLDFRAAAQSYSYQDATTGSTVKTDGDANEYYVKMLNQTPYGCTADGSPANSAAQTVSAIQITQNVHTLLTFRIWLEGTDAQCFDSCVAQSFALDLKLTV